MKSPIQLAKHFITAFQRYVHDEFEELWQAQSHPVDATLDPDIVAEYEAAQKNCEEFREFHVRHSTTMSTNGPCQCTLIKDGNERIVANNVDHDIYEFSCDCGTPLKVLVPKGTINPDMKYDVVNDLVNGHLDHLFTSLHSIPSVDQPGHGGCVYTGIAKWTHDVRARDMINSTYVALELPKLIRLDDTHVRVIMSIFSHSFITGEISCEKFQKVLDSVDDSDDVILYNEKVLCADDIEPFIEWLLIAVAKHVSGDDEQILANLRRNIQSLTPNIAGLYGNIKVETLAAAALFEILYPVKYAIYTTREGLYTLMSSDTLLFHEFFDESEGKIRQPIILCIIVISEGHLDKTVVSPGVGTYIKGKDTLPQWVKASIKDREIDPGSVVELISNWEDNNNSILIPGHTSEDTRKFKRSKIGQWVSKIPQFREMAWADQDANLAKTLLKYSPMGLVLGILADIFYNDLGRLVTSWIQQYRLETHLVGSRLWDERWSYVFGLEMHFIYTFREQFFDASAELMTIHPLTATTNAWVYSCLMEINLPVPKVPRMLAELADHTTAPSAAALQLAGNGTKQSRGRTAAYTFGQKNTNTDKHILCSVAAMSVLVQWITGIDVLDQINERFPPMNNVGLSFAMISSVEIIYELIDWQFLPVESTIAGSKLWKTKLFCELPVGFYWVQLDLRDSVTFTAEHVVAVHIMTDWRLCENPEENVIHLFDNRGQGDFVQMKDIDVKRSVDVGETIFSLFLGIPHSRITSIIKLKRRTAKNSTYAQASRTANGHRDRRLTRQLGSGILPPAPVSFSTKTSSRRKRGKNRSRGGKSTAKKSIESRLNSYKHRPSLPRIAKTKAVDKNRSPVNELYSRNGTFLGPKLT